MKPIIGHRIHKLVFLSIMLTLIPNTLISMIGMTKVQPASAWAPSHLTFTIKSSSLRRRRGGDRIGSLPFQRRAAYRNDIFPTREYQQFQLYSIQTDENEIIYSNKNNNDEEEEEEEGDARYKINLNILAASGIQRRQQQEDDDELNAIQDAISSACQAINNGGGILSASFSINENNALMPPVAFMSVPGCTGRVLLLSASIAPPKNHDENNVLFSTNEEREELWNEVKILISQELDDILFQQQRLTQPILLSILDENDDHHHGINLKDESTVGKYLESLVIQEVEQYEMAFPISDDDNDNIKHKQVIPSLQIEVDGAMIAMPNHNQEEVWDTSTILIFDDVVSDELRQGLLNVVLGRNDEDDNDSGDYWDDVKNGPDPKRWHKGGLIDIPTNNENDIDTNSIEEEDNPHSSGGVGLSDEAIQNLCFKHHEAISKFETQTLPKIFPPKHYKVCRLPPNAIYGDSVSPLTANAPIHGDVYSYHIDADPNVTPPSPWTDVYGRYMNRSKGKPRFMSCLIYLNDKWEYDTWGGPTRFLDVKSDTYYDVQPKPGRVVIMDQDVTHSVVAPRVGAGKRPRYSLVWKLVLHPVVEGQDMSFKRYREEGVWTGEPVYFGSAQRDSAM